MIPKFRGRWHDGGWIHGSCVKFDENICFIMPEFGGASTLSYAQIFNHTAQYVDIETIGQSTGLKDKNGTEIYVGDIVKWTEHVGAIEFLINNQQTVLMGQPEKIITDLDYCTHFNMEIIGNIYENPELLNVR